MSISVTVSSLASKPFEPQRVPRGPRLSLCLLHWTSGLFPSEDKCESDLAICVAVAVSIGNTAVFVRAGPDAGDAHHSGDGRSPGCTGSFGGDDGRASFSGSSSATAVYN